MKKIPSFYSQLFYKIKYRQLLCNLPRRLSTSYRVTMCSPHLNVVLYQKFLVNIGMASVSDRKCFSTRTDTILIPSSIYRSHDRSVGNCHPNLRYIKNVFPCFLSAVKESETLVARYDVGVRRIYFFINTAR